MKLTDKTITFGVLGIILISIIGLIFMMIRINTLESKKDELELKLVLKDNELELFQDDLGLFRAKANTAEADLRSLRNVYDEELKELRESFTSLKRNFSNLSGVTHASMLTVGEIKTILSKETDKDTTFNTNGDIKNIRSVRNFSYVDNWSKFDGRVSFNTNSLIGDNVLGFNYAIKDSVTFVSYYNSTGFLKPKVLVIEGKSYNPNTMISGLAQVQVRPSGRPKYVVAVYAGYGMTKEGLSPNISVGIGRKLFEF